MLNNEYMYNHNPQHQSPTIRTFERDNDYLPIKLFSPDNRVRERQFSPDVDHTLMYQKFSKSPMFSNLGRKLFENDNQYSNCANMWRPIMKFNSVFFKSIPHSSAQSDTKRYRSNVNKISLKPSFMMKIKWKEGFNVEDDK